VFDEADLWLLHWFFREARVAIIAAILGAGLVLWVLWEGVASFFTDFYLSGTTFFTLGLI
jgi:hypothetical protein